MLRNNSDYSIYAVGDQVSPIVSLLLKSPLTTILNFNLSRLPSDCMFALYKSIYGVTVYPLCGSSIKKVWLLINFLMYFKVAFNQDFLTSAGNLVIFVQLLGSGMKCDTSDPNYIKVGNEIFDSFKTSLKTLYKHFPIILTEISVPFRPLCVFLIRSRIFNLVSLALMSGYTCLTS